VLSCFLTEFCCRLENAIIFWINLTVQVIAARAAACALKTIALQGVRLV
jgi:hypothetical protein